jgi:hypothetical protein
LFRQLASQEEDIWHEISDLHFPDGYGCLAVLRCYVDASSRKESGLVSVAGYLFDSLRARPFTKQWRSRFGDERFSWADLVGRSRQFKYLKERDPSEHRALMAAGVSLVRENVIAGTIASIRKSDVEQHSPTWIRGFGHAYSVAGHMALAAMGSWAYMNGYRGGIDYVIEEGDEGYAELAHLLSYATHSSEVKHMYQWHGHSTLPKTVGSPFHAPDLLAWEWGKFILETVEENKRPMRLSFVHLVNQRLQNYKFQHLRGASLMRFFDKITALGVEQMQEDERLVAAMSMDLGPSVETSEQTARDEDPE